MPTALHVCNYTDQKGSKWDKWMAGYVRVSTEAQAEEGYSIDAQIDMIKSQATLLDSHPGKLKLYVDGGFTGSNINRPGMKQLITDAKNNHLTHIIVYKLDRMSRSQKDTLYLIEDVFNTHSISFVSIKESLDTSTPMGRVVIGMLSAFAQLERETIHERMRMGMKERIKNGYWPGGGRVPFGYDYDKNQGILVPNEDAKTVRLIYELYLQGYPTYRVAQMVGLKYEILARQILNRKSNCGYIVYNGEEYKGRHEAIIDEEIYEQAMQVQHERSISYAPQISSYLLSGLVFCGKCGARMRYQKWGKAGIKLVCYSSQKSSKDYMKKDESCEQERIDSRDVEQSVLEALFSFQVKNIHPSSPMEQEVSVLDTLNMNMEATTRKLRRLYDLYAKAEDDTLLESISETKKEADFLKKQINSETARNALTRRKSKLRNKITDLRSNWDALTDQERKAIVNETVERVELVGNQVRVSFRA